MQKKIAIFWFSGTGNTRFAVSLLESELKKQGAVVDVISIADFVKSPAAFSAKNFDLVGFAHPIHCFGTPRIVFDCLMKLPHGAGANAFIVKTAAGRHGPNAGASRPLIKALYNKGYKVFYDRAFMMPSNWAYTHPTEFNRQLCNVLAGKIRHTAGELLEMKSRKIPCGALVGFATYLMWLFEDLGTHFFGKDLRADKKCTHCGKCVRECPAGNIAERKGKIRFGWKCLWCMHCIYTCPERAISPWVEKFVVLKGGYNLLKIINDPTVKGDYVRPDTTGFYARHKDYFFNEAE